MHTKKKEISHVVPKSIVQSRKSFISEIYSLPLHQTIGLL
jgi:hypothetical protein